MNRKHNATQLIDLQEKFLEEFENFLSLHGLTLADIVRILELKNKTAIYYWVEHKKFPLDIMFSIILSFTEYFNISNYFNISKIHYNFHAAIDCKRGKYENRLNRSSQKNQNNQPKRGTHEHKNAVKA
jgi:hypothetical protein